ncbi:serine/threonine-protein kinase [Paraliomyxa miuraensis]|uniref:serine/threonine-protein kinase n=1 Tax=Paraliomyxa miuraensis TaxID=376150 RepID=UPI00225A4B14|nr:serine/threonine-protein kinase [Paraliomyxa miuraensis]MCX4246419.1 serine/threonine-protein kinase [Paraliomyxa miuraensis]
MTTGLGDDDDDATHDIGGREDASTAPAEPVQSPPHTNVKRYVVLEQVGAGGMGVVHRAYDPRLRREVAVKMIRLDRHESRPEARPEARPGDQQEGQHRAATRILREARTMAQLSHPNVLPVYDVEQVGELVYIAMEYVDGEHLGRWLERHAHTWQAVVEVFRQAGEGLQAAHRAGIVHRDFKPANVMMGNKGRVLVTDFGLARACDRDDDLPGSARPIDTSVELTEDGELVGTPAYMPPEQLRGEPVDARADQYAFCLALYEGLFGRRPFLAREPRALLHAKELGTIEAAPDANVPSWLFRVVERGMNPDPAQRFPSMAELLQALGHDPGQARRRWAWAGVGAVVGASAIGLRLVTAPAPDPRCPRAQALIDELWGKQAHDRLRSAMLATSVSYAADAAERVTTVLDDEARAWAEGYVDACEATNVRGEQSTEALDLRMACLRRHRAELETTIEVLSLDVSVATVRAAASMVDDLSDPRTCADVEQLRARERPVDPTRAAELERLREELARATTLSRAGRIDDALESIGRVERSAAGVDAVAVHGEALLLRGSIAIQERNLADAERWLGAAQADGVEARDAPLVVRACTNLVLVVGAELARTTEAELWAAQGRAWLRGRNDDDRLATSLLLAEGNAYRNAGHLERARATLTEAISRMETHPHTGDLADAHRTLGLALMMLGEPDEAELHFTKELTILEARLGPNHPDVGSAHRGLGAAFHASGRLARALPHYEDALRIYERAMGPDHPRVASALSNLGALRDDLGEPDEAREHFERALRILESTGGTNDELVGLLGNLAQALRHGGNPMAAAAALRRAADLVERTHGREHPDHVDVLTRLGETLLEADDTSRAREVLEQADALRRALPPEAALLSADAARAHARLLHREGDHARALSLLSEAIELYRSGGAALDPRRGETLLDLGEVLLAKGEPAAAREPLEAALPLLITPQVSPEALARARFALARALVANEPAGPDAHARATELAQSARLGLPDDDPRRREIGTWLDALARRP